MSKPSAVSRDRIDALLRFLPIFEAPGFVFGEWHEKRGSVPVYLLSPEADEFVRTLYDGKWIVSFDWGKWQDEAEKYVASADALASADLDILRKLLTTHVRKERFCEGHLASMFACGHVTAILQRMRDLGAGPTVH